MSEQDERPQADEQDTTAPEETADNPHYAERSDDDTSPQTGGGVDSEAGEGE